MNVRPGKSPYFRGTLWIVSHFEVDSILGPMSLGVDAYPSPTRGKDYSTFSTSIRLKPGTFLLVSDWVNGLDNPFHTYARVVLPQECYVDTGLFSDQKRIKRIA